MKVPLSWIREFVDVKADAEAIGALMGVRGLPLEGLVPHGDDLVMDFEVHANRPDLLSVKGIAREIATAYQLPLRSEGDGFSHRQSAIPPSRSALRRTRKPSLSERQNGSRINRFPSRSRNRICAGAISVQPRT